VPIRLHRTKYFRILERDYLGDTAHGHHIPDATVLAFQKVLSPSFPKVLWRVANRCLAVDEALHHGLARKDPLSLLQGFRRSRSLQSEARYRAWLHAHYLSQEDLLTSLGERALARASLALYRRMRTSSSASGDLYKRIRNAVATRTGLSEHELMGPPFMRPGVLWEEPLIREIKLSGGFREALDVADRIVEFDRKLFQECPETKVAFDSLISFARDSVESWTARRWGIGAHRLVSALRKRGFVRYREFLEVARMAYHYETHGPGLGSFPK
jgi:hypothetical protein